MKSKNVIEAFDDLDPAIVREAEPGRRKKALRAGAVIAAAALIAALLLALGVGFALKKNSAPPEEDTVCAARVYLDVNPSVVFEITKSGKILSVVPGNADAEKICAPDDAKNEDLNAGILALLGKIADAGYLNAERDTLLLSVESEDGAFSDMIRNNLKTVAARFFESRRFSGHVLTQKMSDNQKAREIANRYGISKSAATYLLRLLGVEKQYTEEYLASLDITELRRLCEENGISTENDITMTIPEACKIAYDAFETRCDDYAFTTFACGYVNKESVGVWRVGLFGEHNIAVFEIDDETGEIVFDDRLPCLSRIESLESAVKELGYTKEEIYHYDLVADPMNVMMWAGSVLPLGTPKNAMVGETIDLMNSAGWRIYMRPLDSEVYLEVLVNACSGKIVSVEKTDVAIFHIDAYEIALADAGVSRDDLKWGPGSSAQGGVIDVQFRTDTTRYRYKIDSLTGEILSKESVDLNEKP